MRHVAREIYYTKQTKYNMTIKWRDRVDVQKKWDLIINEGVCVSRASASQPGGRGFEPRPRDTKRR